MRKTTAQVALFDIDNLVREGDLETSLAAATKALRASKKAVKTVRRVLADGVERIDEEIWNQARDAGCISSFSVVRHARLALQRAGLVESTNATRKTSEGSQSTVWRTKEPVTRKAIKLDESTTLNPRRAMVRAQKKRNEYAQRIVEACNRLEEKIAQVDGEREAAIADGNDRGEIAARCRSKALGEALEIVEKILGENSEKEQEQ